MGKIPKEKVAEIKEFSKKVTEMSKDPAVLKECEKARLKASQASADDLLVKYYDGG